MLTPIYVCDDVILGLLRPNLWSSVGGERWETAEPAVRGRQLFPGGAESRGGDGFLLYFVSQPGYLGFRPRLYNMSRCYLLRHIIQLYHIIHKENVIF